MRLVDYDADEAYLLDGRYKVNAYKVEHTVDGVPVGFLAEPNDNSKELVEVVRCKDCENYEHIVMAADNEGNVTKECDFCNHWKRIMSEQNVNDFCSYGERKEQEHE